jgi:L-cystine transport system substrate-binding protein
MKKNIYTAVGVATVSAAGLFFLAGCGNDKKAAGEQELAETGIPVKTIKFNVVSQYKPYGYFDEDGKLQGYEPAVLKALDKVVPEYKFDFITSSADSFTDLKTGKADALASQWYSNAERQEKYTLTKEAYTYYGNYIAWDGDHKENNFQTLDALRGKTVIGYPGSAEVNVSEVFNKEKGGKDPIKIKYTTSVDTAKTIKDFQSGAIDAEVTTDYNVKEWNKAFKSNIVTSNKAVFSGGTYYILKKGNTELQTALDEGIKKLKADGTLKKLSEKYLGGDYTEDPAS